MVSAIALSLPLLLVMAEAEPIEVRIGVVAYESSNRTLVRLHQLFTDLEQGNNPPLRVRIATGTYGDVLHWLKRELIDVAVLTPGLYAEVLAADGDGSKLCEYLVTVGLPAPSGSENEKSREGYRDFYRSKCLVSTQSSLQTIDSLREAAQAGRVRFLFVHPLSVSGRIAPEFALKQIGIAPARERIEYTYSHTESIRLLAQHDEAGLEKVAFVWDGALAGDTSSQKVRPLDFPELESLEVPSDVIVARKGYQHTQRIKTFLAEHQDPQGNHDFPQSKDWSKRFNSISQWNEAIGLVASSSQGQKVTLDEVGQMLLHYSRSQPRPPRLALVLSGGGAKCAFQVGAVAALEEKLAEIRKLRGDKGLDIALVVGTSGGAINAVPVALGITSTAEGQKDFQDVWMKLDQRDIVRPSWIVRANIGLWFALFQAACALCLVRCITSDPARQGWWFVSILAFLAAVEIAVGYLHWSPWSWFGENHLWHHAWLWCTFGVRASAWSLLVVSLAGIIAQRQLTRRERHLAAPGWIVKSIFAVCLLGLPVIQVVTVLFFQQTLSGGQGIEHALSENFPNVINNHLARQNISLLDMESASSDADRLKLISRQVIERRLLKRDLVLTGSCLERTAGDLSSDLYFYGQADPDAAAPQFDARGISFNDHPSILMDVVMGSGSIFPVFPPRVLNDFPEPGSHVELVDGGFAHNSPIEAAVLWGATHIVLIEASPKKQIKRENFLYNSLAAFSHLYKQAQLLDTHSRERVTIFTLAPEAPHVCVIDFADNLIRSAIDKGYREARANPGDSAGFQKEPGEPTFIEVGANQQVR